MDSLTEQQHFVRIEHQQRSGTLHLFDLEARLEEPHHEYNFYSREENEEDSSSSEESSSLTALQQPGRSGFGQPHHHDGPAAFIYIAITWTATPYQPSVVHLLLIIIIVKF